MNYVIKYLLPEILTLVKLKHENIIRYYECFADEEEENFYIITEYCNVSLFNTEIYES